MSEIYDVVNISLINAKIAVIRNMPLYNCYFNSSLLHYLRTILVSGKGSKDGWEDAPEVRILIFLMVVIQ